MGDVDPDITVNSIEIRKERKMLSNMITIIISFNSHFT